MTTNAPRTPRFLFIESGAGLMEPVAVLEWPSMSGGTEEQRWNLSSLEQRSRNFKEHYGEVCKATEYAIGRLRQMPSLRNKP